MERIDRDHHGVPRPDLSPTEGVVGLRRARHQSGGRVEAQRLVQDASRQRQAGHVRRLGRTVAQHGTRLGRRGLLHLGIEGAEIERPAERQGCRLMPRDHEGQQIVAQFGRGHLPAGLRVRPGHQQVQKVRHLAGSVRLSRGDRGVGHGLHPRQRPPGVDPARTRNPVGHAEHVEQRHLARRRDVGVDGPVHGGPVEPPVAGKRDIRDHVERGPRHLVQHVDGARSRLRDTVRHILRRAGHVGGKRGDVAGREHRRRRPPLPAPMRALGHEQAFADGRTQQVLGHVGLRIVLEPVQHDMADRAGVHDHVPADAGAARHDRLGGGDLRQDAQDVPARRAQAAQDAHRTGHQGNPDGPSSGAGRRAGPGAVNRGNVCGGHWRSPSPHR